MTWEAQIVLWLHRWLAAQPGRFWAALVLTDRVPWLLSSMALIALWFAQGEGSQTNAAGFRRRARVLATLLAAMLAFGLARGTAHRLARPRPFALLPMQAPLPPTTWQHIREAVGDRAAFPADQVAFWAALTAGMFTLAPGWAGPALLGTWGVALLQVGLGYHYPSDVVAGFWIGVLVFVLVDRLWPRMAWLWEPLLLLFQQRPGLAYAGAALVALDVSQRLHWLFGLAATLLGVFRGNGP